MEFQFIKPSRPTKTERRVVTRNLKAQLVERLATREGVPVNRVRVLQEKGRVRALLSDGRRLDFQPIEEEAITAAQEWEQTGEGDVPRLPL